MKIHQAGLKKLATKFDKYALYLESVQSPDVDVRLLQKIYKELRGKTPRTLREDFCGTFALCAEWVKLDAEKKAYGVDLDPEPIQYGRFALSALSSDRQKRIHIQQMNVLDRRLPAADVAVALNFSFFIFKSKDMLRKYFANALKKLKPGGIFAVDVFGGSACQDETEETSAFRGFRYYWHQHGYDPITAEAKFSIHFKPKGKRKIKDVFTYDWRMWTIPEIREVMHEVGFKKTHIYWEGTNRKGAGSGKFYRREKGEECLAWVAYVIGERLNVPFIA